MPEDEYSLGNYGLSSAWDADRFSNLGLGTGTNSGRRFSLYGPKEGNNFMEGLGSSFSLNGDSEGNFMEGLDLGVDTDINANLGLLNNTETGGGFLEGLNFGNISKGLGLASSMYSDYMQNKYLNAAMDTMDANLAMAQKADDTHYKNAAGFDNYSSSRTA